METLLNMLPKQLMTVNGIKPIVIRWSGTENKWIVGYGIQTTINNRKICGIDQNLEKAILKLIKIAVEK